MSDRALTTAIPVELLLVPIGLSLAWMEFGRWRVLRSARPDQGYVTATVLFLQKHQELIEKELAE